MGNGERGNMVTAADLVESRHPRRMVASLQSHVPAAAAGQSLLDWLVARFPYHDADGWRAALARGAVRRNGAVAAAGDVLAAGDQIAYATAASPAAEPDVAVLHADADVVVVDKPAGLVVQHASSWPGRTFLARLATRFPPVADAERLEPVHRLDRSTSGVLLLARHAAATTRWSQAFAASAVEKCYLALVQGVPTADAWHIDAAIGPAIGATARARRATYPAGTPGAQPASTWVEVVERLPAHALVRLRPRTGRTHQLRVHLAAAGHPIVGDPLYGATDAAFLAWVAARRAEEPLPAGSPPRTLLHAESLAGLGWRWSAPPPPDFVAALDARRRH